MGNNQENQNQVLDSRDLENALRLFPELLQSLRCKHRLLVGLLFPDVKYLMYLYIGLDIMVKKICV